MKIERIDSWPRQAVAIVVLTVNFVILFFYPKFLAVGTVPLWLDLIFFGYLFSGLVAVWLMGWGRLMAVLSFLPAALIVVLILGSFFVDLPPSPPVTDVDRLFIIFFMISWFAVPLVDFWREPPRVVLEKYKVISQTMSFADHHQTWLDLSKSGKRPIEHTVLLPDFQARFFMAGDSVRIYRRVGQNVIAKIFGCRFPFRGFENLGSV